jgi:hypothetical protein
MASSKTARVPGRGHDHQPVLPPGERLEIGMAGETRDPTRVAFELPDRCHHKVRVANGHMEAHVPVPPCEPRDSAKKA